MNFYEGVGTADNPNPYTNYSYNITSLVSGGGTYYVRIGEVNNVDTLNLGVDNVSVVYTPVSAPEPGSAMPTLGGIVGIAILLWRRQRRLSPRDEVLCENPLVEGVHVGKCCEPQLK